MFFSRIKAGQRLEPLQKTGALESDVGAIPASGRWEALSPAAQAPVLSAQDHAETRL